MPDVTDPFSDDSLPPRLREAFAGLREARPIVPAALDAMILSDAHAGYARRRRVGLWIGRAGMAAAAAAAIGLTVHLAVPHVSTGPKAATVARIVEGDANGDGRLDIVDALVVARAVQGGTATAAMDVNRDGQVDRQDADWIGRCAVQVDGGGGQ